MTSIKLKLAPLQKKIQEMIDDGIDSIRLTIHDEAEDQNDSSSAFLYIEGYTRDGQAKDYDSIDSIDPPTPKVPNITFLENYSKNA